MKKSKIIIPALAAIAFSTVASITGTVAWFTSQSAVSISTTAFKISGLDGELSVTGAAGVGTSVTGENDSTKISLIEGAQLTHGSFDHNTSKVYSYDQFSDTPSYINKTGAVLGTNQVAADFKENASGNLYNAVTWTLTFKYASTKVGDVDTYTLDNPVNLYFDIRPTISYTTPGLDDLTDNDKNAGRGFRMAFVNANQSVAKVWSPLQGKKYLPGGTVDTCYVNSATTTATYDTDENGDLMWAGEQADNSAALKYITTSSGTTGRTDYLGQFNSDNGGVVTLTCVVWFEGSDPNVENVSALPEVTAAMGFYVKQNVAA